MNSVRARDESVVAALRRRLGPATAVTRNNFAWFAARRGAMDVALDVIRGVIAMPAPPPAAWRALERLAAGRSDGMLLATEGATPDTAAPAAHPLAAAIAAHQHGDVAVAEICYRAALQVGHGRAAWNGLAVLHEQRHERAAADDAWRHALAEPDGVAVHNHAMAMLRRGFPHRARVSLGPWLQTTRTSGPLQFVAGYAALTDQDPAAAIPLLQTAVDLAPDLARAHFTLGLAYERLQLHADALAAIRRALLLSPWYVPHVWLLGGDDGAEPFDVPAERDADRDDDPTDDVLLSLGRSLLQTAHLGEALATVDQVLVRHPGQPAALFHRGVVLAKLRRYGEALEDWAVVEQSDPASELGHASRRHARSARQLATLFASG